MANATIPLILTSVLLTAGAQITLKAGMMSPHVAQSMASGLSWGSVQSVLLNPLVIGGLAIYFLSALVWLIVLSRVDVSFAYPFVGIGFIVTMLLGWLVHGEDLSSPRIVGTLIITVGVAVLARS